MMYQASGDRVYVFENFLSSAECDRYYKMIPDLGHHDEPKSWEERTKEISDDPIVKKAQAFIKKKLKLDLKLSSAQLQNWHINSYSHPHIHTDLGRNATKHNSLIYLNNNFLGGEFVTKSGILIRPKKGMLTLFDGQRVYHGVKRVKQNDRKTIIFWWRN